MKNLTETLELDKEAIEQKEKQVAGETDQQIMQRMADRFHILTEMTKAVKKGAVRAMIVSGPPGVGKSFNVEEVLDRYELVNRLGGLEPQYEIVKGSMSAVGLFAKLYEFRNPNCVLVFDDADGIFFDDTTLNLLKGALDTSPRRVISWNSDSRLLRAEGIPNTFEFKGSIIFISNIKFSHVRSKRLRNHLDALQSRCHYIDLDMDTAREKLLRIKQVIRDTDMLAKYKMTPEQQAELIKFIEDNKNKLRELSLRTVLKAADLRQNFPASWQTVAKTTLMYRT